MNKQQATEAVIAAARKVLGYTNADLVHLDSEEDLRLALETYDNITRTLWGGLSPQEMRVLWELSKDAPSDREIGERLGITTATVKVHMKALRAKLGKNNRTGLAVAGLGHFKGKTLEQVLSEKVGP